MIRFLPESAFLHRLAEVSVRVRDNAKVDTEVTDSTHPPQGVVSSTRNIDARAQKRGLFELADRGTVSWMKSTAEQLNRERRSGFLG
jgi:hypothetical protein